MAMACATSADAIRIGYVPCVLYAYLAALVIGLGTALLQVVMPGHGHDVGHDAGHDHDGLGASIFLSTRFWTFALLAGGLVGTLLTVLRLSGSTLALVLALLSGLASGMFAALTIRALKRSDRLGRTSLEEAVGQVGRVMLPCAKGKIGKVRLLVKGQSVDVLAMTNEDELAIGAKVIVSAMEGGYARVVKAPDEIA